jgi:L-iditol 2-dehydrogenase
VTLPNGMRAAVLYDVDDVRVESRPVPALQTGDVLVRTAASGICTGDVLPWYIRRKAPLVLGHEPAGTIAAIDDAPVDASGNPLRAGDRVFVHHHAACGNCAACARGDAVQCDAWRAGRIDPGAMAEYFRVPSGNLRDTLRLPDDVAFTDAALIEPLACVVKSLRRGGVRAGETLYVIGLGVMGLMHVAAGVAAGARVFGSDFIVQRREAATELGATTFHPEDAGDALGSGARVVICGPGTPAAFEAAVTAAAPGGTVVAFTPFEPGTALPIDVEKFYFRDLRLVGSYSCGPADTRAALRLIRDRVVSARKLGATTIALDDVPNAYRALARAEMVKPIVLFA